jgi:cytochrome c5
MVTQKQRSSTTVAAFFLALSSVCIAPALLAEGSDGKGVFEAQKCNLCHAVSSAGIEAKTKSEKLKGPDLVNLAKDFEAEWIAKYLLKKAADKEGKSHEKPFKGSDEELQALVDWLLEQKVQS